MISRKIYDRTFTLLLGILIGISIFWNVQTPVSRQIEVLQPAVQDQDQSIRINKSIKPVAISADSLISVNDLRTSIVDRERRLSQHLFQTVRILCWVMTAAGHGEKMQAVMDTWGPRCNTLLFIAAGDAETSKEELMPRAFLIKLKMKEQYGNLWQKTKLAFAYVVQNYKDTFDWVLKVDDDSFVFLENLRLFLHDKSKSAQFYYGAQYKSNGGYNSGGPGYVISGENLLKLMGVFEKPGCNGVGTHNAEDVEIAKCLKMIGIVAADTRDGNGRFRWSPFEPQHTMNHSLLPTQYRWFWSFTAHTLNQGYECCADSFVSFHYIKPNLMRNIEYLSYYAHPFSERSVWKYD